MAGLGLAERLSTTPPACSESIWSARPVLRSFTVDRSSLDARPAMAEGARLFFAVCVCVCVHVCVYDMVYCECSNREGHVSVVPRFSP